MAFNDISATLFLHILFVFIWLTTLPIALLLRKMLSDNRDTDFEFKLFRYRGIVAGLAIIGGLGVVLTGAWMTFRINGYEFFDFSGDLWLPLKQVIWVITFVGGALLIAPLETKLKNMLEEEESIIEIRALMNKMDQRSFFFTSLILVNIFLATTKPI